MYGQVDLSVVVQTEDRLSCSLFSPRDPSMTEEDRIGWKRDKIVRELVDTEERFVEVLTVLTDLQCALGRSNCLTSEEIESVFANLADIRTLQRSFLCQLLHIESNSPPLAEDVHKLNKCSSLAALFESYASNASLFALYCTNHASLTSSKRLVHLLRDRTEFSSFVHEHLQSPQAKKQTLQSLLAAVPQRVCKYPLLLREYLKTLEPEDASRPALQSAYDTLGQLLEEIDQKTVLSSDFWQLKELQDRLLTPKRFDLLEEGRGLVFEGDFLVAAPHSYGSYAFLLTDLLLIAKPRGKIHSVTRVIPLSALLVCPAGEKPSQGYTLQLGEVPVGFFQVQFTDYALYERWGRLLHQKLEPSRSHILVAPRMPREDELTLQLTQMIVRERELEETIRLLQKELTKLSGKDVLSISSERSKKRLSFNSPRSRSCTEGFLSEEGQEESPRSSSRSSGIFQSVKNSLATGGPILTRIKSRELPTQWREPEPEPEPLSDRSQNTFTPGMDLLAQVALPLSRSGSETPSHTEFLKRHADTASGKKRLAKSAAATLESPRKALGNISIVIS